MTYFCKGQKFYQGASVDDGIIPEYPLNTR